MHTAHDITDTANPATPSGPATARPWAATFRPGPRRWHAVLARGAEMLVWLTQPQTHPLAPMVGPTGSVLWTSNHRTSSARADTAASQGVELTAQLGWTSTELSQLRDADKITSTTDPGRSVTGWVVGNHHVDDTTCWQVQARHAA